MTKFQNIMFGIKGRIIIHSILFLLALFLNIYFQYDSFYFYLNTVAMIFNGYNILRALKEMRSENIANAFYNEQT